MDTFDPKPALAKYAGQPHRRQGEGRRHRPAGLAGAADAEPVQLQEVRAERHRGVRDLPAPQPARRRDRLPALGLRAVERPRAGHLRDADRADQPGIPQRRLVGHLRPGLGVVEPAGLRGDDRCPRRPAGRPERLERRLHAGRLPGHALPLHRRPDRRPQAAGRRDAGRSARPARRAGQAERARHAEVPRQQRAGGAHLVLRAGLPHAGLRARRGGRGQRVGRDQSAVRPRRQGDRAVRPAVPDGASAGRARRALRAGVLGRGRQPERRHLGRARRRQGQPHPARRRDRQADGRPAARTCAPAGCSTRPW